MLGAAVFSSRVLFSACRRRARSTPPTQATRGPTGDACLQRVTVCYWYVGFEVVPDAIAAPGHTVSNKQYVLKLSTKQQNCGVTRLAPFYRQL